MTKPYHFFRDSTGRLQAIAITRGNAVVADFLATDIGENATHCDSALDMLERRLAGEHAEQDDSIGNIYRLSVDGDSALLENIHDEQAPSARIAGLEMIDILKEWRNHF